MLTKKIHSQPRPLTRTPPISGPNQAGDAGRGSPQAQGGAAAGCQEDAGDGRQGLRRQQPGTDALHRPSGDQHGGGAGQATPHRCGGEHRQADQVEVLGTEPVAEPARHQQHHRITQQVGAGHPDDVGIADMQLSHDGRVGDRDDGRVQHDHEEADHHRRQRVPRVPRVALVEHSTGHRGHVRTSFRLLTVGLRSPRSPACIIPGVPRGRSVAQGPPNHCRGRLLPGPLLQSVCNSRAGR